MKASRAVMWFGGLAVGCVGVAASPPTPPLVEPVTSGPMEYQWTLLKWEPGKKLTYRSQGFTETRTGDETRTDTVQSMLSMTGMERTAKGLVRVNVEMESTVVGFLLVDGAGHVQDAVPAGPESADIVKMVARMAESPMVRSFQAKVLKINERHRIKSPWSDVLGDVPWEVSRLFGPNIEMDYEFTGFKRIGVARVAAVRFATDNLVETPVEMTISDLKQRKQRVKLDSMSIEGFDYRDPEQGFSIATYMVLTMGGESSDQKRFILRMITVTSLDRGNSRGIE